MSPDAGAVRHHLRDCVSQPPDPPCRAARLASPRGNRSDHFGVHLLKSDQVELAHRFADRTLEDKFAGLEWSWDDDVPELADVLSYLRLRRAENFVRYDHTILIGDLERGRIEQGSPLLYARRRMDWLMQPMR